MPPEFITTKEILLRIRVTKGTLCKMIKRGDFPKPTGRIGKNDVWPPAMLDAWMAGKLGEAK